MTFIDFILHPITFNFLVLAASLFILFKSADYIVYGISNYAKKLGLSDAIIGLLIISMAASAPEIISSFIGFIQGETSIGIGTIIGTNMVHAGLALGILCLIGKKITLEPTIFTKRKLIMWAALMLPLALILDGNLGRFDGIILLTAFAAYLYELWKIEGSFGKLKKNVKLKTIWKDMAIFLFALAALLMSGQWLVISSLHISQYFTLPAYFVALTIIGIGTTIPDLSVELRSLFKKHSSIGLGDLLGSLILELLLFLGLVALFHPISISVPQSINSIIFLGITITLIMTWMKNNAFTWKHGLVLLGIYATFMTVEILNIL